MKSSALLAYQSLTGISDTGTGAVLCIAPVFTLQLMGIHPPPDATPYIAYIGSFVLSVGLACIYGVLLLMQRTATERLETVWLLTAISRSAIAIYVTKSVLAGQLEPAWITIALFDGACAAIQGFGLRHGWLRHAR